MFSTSRRLAFASLAVLTIACGASLDVRTMSAPEANFSTLHTFRMLPGPALRGPRPANDADDPMISNSIANRAIRAKIVQEFTDRGYTVDEQHPDFLVAFYATAREKLDVTTLDYGYPFNPAWGRYGPPAQTITQYVEGSVIVDVLTPGNRELLWRGQGKAELSDTPAENVKQLVNAAGVIVSKFPHATARVVADRP